MEGDLPLLLSEADRALGALNVVVTVLPNPDLLVGMFIQKEALLSSQIEGTQSFTPGEFRRMQNWIGGTSPANARFVPPPPETMQQALGAFERYLHAEDAMPPLIRCGLLHYQFETIHPFNDGNGRVGRLLITLYLVWKGILDEPMLYLSAYLKNHQQEYYDRLTQVRTDGNFEAWTRFFLEGIREVSRMVLATTKKIQALERQDSDRLVDHGEGSHGLALLRGQQINRGRRKRKFIYKA